jgi:hypothetical protein
MEWDIIRKWELDGLIKGNWIMKGNLGGNLKENEAST